MNAPLLQLQQLNVRFGAAPVVRGVDLQLAAGEILGIVGESGSGKTQLLLSMLGLNPPGAQVSGSIRLRGRELRGLSPTQWNTVRGDQISMVFQDPMTALNPYLTVGRQLTEVLEVHQGIGGTAARTRAEEMLDSVHVADARQRLQQYPHQLSGGLRQRVMIAMALIAQPAVLLADEPTTALDVTVQAQILSLLRELRTRTGAAIVLVTHDLGVVAELADRVAVMYAGAIVEQASVAELFQNPRHPYTEALQRSLPPLQGPPPRRPATIGGAPPDPGHLPTGCAFAPRCLYQLPICHQADPALQELGAGHAKACHYQGALGRLQASAP